MKKLKNSAMLVVAVLCGYLALMTPDWKNDVVAAMNPGYQSDYNGVKYAGWYWQGNAGANSTYNEIWRLTFPLYSASWSVPTRSYPPPFLVQDSWDIVANGDFSNDNSSDVLYRHNTTGDWKVWQLLGGVRQNQTNLVYDAAHEWTVVGTGDTDGDQDDDVILFKPSTGELDIWTGQASGAAATLTAHYSLGIIEAGYTPVRIGDFNGDGDADIMTQNGTQLHIMEIQNNAFVPPVKPGFGTGVNWTTVCAADFDKDGDSDVMLREITTLQEKWSVVSNYGRTSQSFGSVNTGFKHLACGDFDGDGDADMLTQRISDDFTRVVLQEGFGVTSKQTVMTNPYGSPTPGGEGYGFVWRGSSN